MLCVFFFSLVESNYLFKIVKIGEYFIKSNIALEFDEKLLNRLHELELKPFAEVESIKKIKIFHRNSMLFLLNSNMFDGGEIIGTFRPKAFFPEGRQNSK